MEGERGEWVRSTVEAAAPAAGAASGDAAAWSAAAGVPATPPPPASTEERDGVEGMTSTSTSAAQSVRGCPSVRASCASSFSLSISSAG